MLIGSIHDVFNHREFVVAAVCVGVLDAAAVLDAAPLLETIEDFADGARLSRRLAWLGERVEVATFDVQVLGSSATSSV